MMVLQHIYNRSSYSNYWNKNLPRNGMSWPRRCRPYQWGYDCHIPCQCKGRCIDMTGYCTTLTCKENRWGYFSTPRAAHTTKYKMDAICSLQAIDMKKVQAIYITNYPIQKKTRNYKNALAKSYTSNRNIPGGLDRTTYEFSKQPPQVYIMVVFTQPVSPSVMQMRLADRDDGVYVLKIFVSNNSNNIGNLTQKNVIYENTQKFGWNKRQRGQEPYLLLNLNYTKPGTHIVITTTKKDDRKARFLMRTLKFYNCIHGTFGDRCLYPCGHCLNNSACDRNGFCPEGRCAPGFTGPFCQTVCKPGFYGEGCVNKCSPHCEATSQTCYFRTGKCRRCKTGYKPPTCQHPCPRGKYGYGCRYRCDQCYKKKCHNIQGYCIIGCKLGYKGNGCNIKCSPGTYGPSCKYKCDNCIKKLCDRKTGNCDLPNCEGGYIGTKCDQTCPAKTYGSNCTLTCNCFGNFTCHPKTGNCGSHGCSLFWIGSRCDIYHKCPVNTYSKTCSPCGHCKETSCGTKTFCSQRCHYQTGLCSAGCRKGFTGERCDQCSELYYGKKCEWKCGYCHDFDLCHATNGICIHHNYCSHGYLGSKCDTECSDGLWGYRCKNKCSPNCLTVCSKIDGSCSPCKLGYTGELCDQLSYCNVVDENGQQMSKWGEQCDKDCFHCKHGLPCSQKDGNCLLGCEKGYKGLRCDTECDDGEYGENCKHSCGYCVGWMPCDKKTGLCTHGCLNNYVPPNCLVCKKPYIGLECDKICGHCAHHMECNSHSGGCPDGCQEGFTGHYCDKRKTEIFPEELVMAEWAHSLEHQMDQANQYDDYDV